MVKEENIVAAVPAGYYLGKIIVFGLEVFVSMKGPLHGEILGFIPDCWEGRVHPRGGSSSTYTSIGVHMFLKRSGGRNGGILMLPEGESVPADGQIVVAICFLYGLCTILDRSPGIG